MAAATRRASSRLSSFTIDRRPGSFLVIDEGQFLAASRLYHKATRKILNQPWRLKMPLLRRGRVTDARGVTTNDEREQVGCFHLVNDKNAGLDDRGEQRTSPCADPRIIRARSRGRIAQVG